MFVGTLDVTNVLSVSKSDGIIGSLRLVAILTKYELNYSVNSDSFCTTLSSFFNINIGLTVTYLSICTKFLKKIQIVFGSSFPSSVFV